MLERENFAENIRSSGGRSIEPKPHPYCGHWADFSLPPSYVKNWPLRFELATHPDTPVFKLVDLLEDEHPRVRGAAAMHLRTPRSAVQFLIDFGSCPDLKELTPPSRALDAKSRKRLQGGGPWARLLAIAHPDGNAAGDLNGVSAVVKKLLALQRYTPIAILRLLAGDENSSVRFLTSHHPAAQGVCFQYMQAGATRRLASEGKPVDDVSLAFLEELTIGNRWQRQLAAKHHLTTPSNLQKLAEDPSNIVRQAVANNAAAPLSILLELAKDVWPLTRAWVARHPQVTSVMLSQLGGDPDPEVRESVALSPYTYAETLAELVHDKVYEVRLGAARNTRTPREVLFAVRRDEKQSAELRAVAQGTLITPTVLPLLRDSRAEICKGERSEGVCADPTTLQVRPEDHPQEPDLQRLLGLRIDPPRLDPTKTKLVEQTDVRDRIDRIAVDAVIAIEQRLTHQAEERAHQNRGYDVHSVSTDKQHMFYIEVKGKGPNKREAQISRSQIELALEYPERFCLALVRTDGERALEVFYIFRPFAEFSLPLNPAILSVTFDIQRLTSKGKRVWSYDSFIQTRRKE